MKTAFVPRLPSKTAHLGFAFACTALIACGLGAKIAVDEASSGYDELESYLHEPSMLFNWKPRLHTNDPASPIGEKPATAQPATVAPMNPLPSLQ